MFSIRKRLTISGESLAYQSASCRKCRNNVIYVPEMGGCLMDITPRHMGKFITKEEFGHERIMGMRGSNSRKRNSVALMRAVGLRAKEFDDKSVVRNDIIQKMGQIRCMVTGRIKLPPCASGKRVCAYKFSPKSPPCAGGSRRCSV